ncbi:MAG TPA: hypothetical protein VF292_10020 [Rhodanobacteraceae bacterium]
MQYIGTQTQSLAEHKDKTGRVTSVSTVIKTTPATTTVGTTGTLEPVPHQPNMVIVDVATTRLARLRTLRSGGLELQVPDIQTQTVKRALTLQNGVGTVSLPDDYVLRISTASAAPGH